MAGLFYPEDPVELQAQVDALIQAAPRFEGPAPRALIAPHAGYVYSGPVAATAYRTLASVRQQISRVLLIGPAHRVWVEGLALPDADVFTTPLGDVPLDREAMGRLAQLSFVEVVDPAHALEHSLEVQLPFLQRVLAAFELVPLVAGGATPEQIAQALELVWDEQTLAVISSDLSHYHAYETARRLDAETTAAIEALDPERLDEESACGRLPIRGLLLEGQRRGLHVRTLDVRNSGDTAGPRDRVVGYGAWALV